MDKDKWISVLALATVLPGWAAGPLPTASFAKGMRTFGDRTFEALMLENEYCRLTFVPDRGGRVVEWIDKRQGGFNVVNLPADSAEPVYGGLLDDHGWLCYADNSSEFYNTRYDYTVRTNANGSISIAMWPTGKNHYQRRVALRADSPVIEIVYTFSNPFQEPGENILIRNVVWPSGGPNPQDHLYVTPMRSGIRVDGRFVNTAQGHLPEPIGACWRAFSSISQKRLVAFAFSDDLLEGAYDWEGSVTRPTFEWYYKPVPMGKAVETRVWAFLAHGYTQAVHVSEQLVADLAPVRRGGLVELGWNISAVDPELKEAILKTAVTRPEGQPLHNLADIPLADLRPDQPLGGKLSWASAELEPVVIRQEVHAAGRAIARYEIPFEMGTNRYERKIAYPAKAVFTDVPGWKHQPPLVVTPDEADRKRGYLVFSAEGERAGTHLKNLAVDLGIGEYESMELRLQSLGEIGSNVTVTAHFPRGPRSMTTNHVRIAAAEKHTLVNWGKETVGWKLTERNRVEPREDGDSRLWIVLNSRGLQPGDYRIDLRFQPDRGPACLLPVRIRVWQVRLPEDRHFYLQPHAFLNHLGLGKQKRKPDGTWEWNIPGVSVYADDLHAHGARMIFAYAYDTAPGGSVAPIRLRDDGRPLIEALKTTPERFAPGKPWPALDLSFWDPWLQVWIDRGFIRYSGGYLSMAPSHLHKGLAKQYGLDADTTYRWLLVETSRYLKEKGFRYVYGCIGDEIAADLFDWWSQAATTARSCGWSPGVTTGNFIFEDSALYRRAGPLMDYWILGDPQADLIEQAKRDGYITPGDSVGSYAGWSTRFAPYGGMRATCWSRVMNATDTFWIQCYIRNFGESIVFDEDGIPYSSAAWEGARDGCEDANYIRAILALTDLLREQVRPGETAAFRARLDAIVEGADRTTVRARKTDLLRLLVDMRKILPRVKPSLVWHDVPLIESGRPNFKLAAAEAGRSAAEHFNHQVEQKTGIAMEWVTAADAPGGAAIVFGHPDDTPLLRTLATAGVELGVTAHYPPADSYLIRKVDHDNRMFICVIGKGEGLARGAKNLFHFLSLNPEYPEQYFPSR